MARDVLSEGSQGFPNYPEPSSKAHHLLITVHGIRTFGKWQERLTRLVKNRSKDIEVYNYSYGFFSILAFLTPPLRWFVTLRFRKQLVALLKPHPKACLG
jgi:hypothetical protein